jgi:hypothetical protein
MMRIGLLLYVQNKVETLKIFKEFFLEKIRYQYKICVKYVLIIIAMSSLTINMDNDLKTRVQAKSKKDNTTITFIVTQALKAYSEGKLVFGLISSDDEITASFDVSTLPGKKDCMNSFKALCK